MKHINSLIKMGALLTALALGNANATLLQVNSSGILTGASGVNVNGNFYDVTFLDGSCNSLFDGCNATKFAFTDLSSALAASQALLDQVFINNSQGSFDDNPFYIQGCGYNYYCEAFTAYSTNTMFNSASFTWSLNWNPVYGNPDLAAGPYNWSSDLTTGPTYDTSGAAVWAVWTHSPSEVSEPGSIAILSIGLLMLITTMRRKYPNVGVTR